MSDGETLVWLQLAAWCALFVLLFVLGFLEYMGRRHWAEIRTGINSIQADLDATEQPLSSIFTVKEQYEPNDLPLFAAAEELHKKVAEVGVHLNNVRGRYPPVRDHVQRISNNPPIFAFRNVRLWLHRTRREITSLRELCEHISALLDRCEELCDELRQKPQQVQTAFQALTSRINDMRDAATTLEQRGVQDALFSAALGEIDQHCRAVEKLHTSLTTLPPELFTRPKDTRITREHKQLLYAIDQQRASLEGEVKQLEQTLRTWYAIHSDVESHIDDIDKRICAIDADTSKLAPVVIDLQIITKQTTPIRDRFDALKAVFRAPDAAHLPDILVEAKVLLRDSTAKATDVKGHLKTLRNLQHVVVQNETAYAPLPGRIAGFSAGPLPRITPLETGPKLSALETRLHTLGGANAQRRLADLSLHLAEAQQITDDLHQLKEKFDRIDEARRRIIDVRAGPDATLDQDMPGTAEELAKHVAQYDPGNWAPELRVTAFADDARTLAKRQSQFLEPALNDQAIDDSQIVGLANAAVQVVTDRRELAVRQNAIATRLADVVSTYDEAREIYATTQRAFTDLKMKERDWRGETEVVTHLKQLERRRSEEQQVKLELDCRDRGLVADKLRCAETWAANCCQAGEKLRQALDARVTSQVDQLSQQLERVQEHARLQQENAVREAKMLLAGPATVSVPAEAQSLAAMLSQIQQAETRYWEMRRAQKPLDYLADRVAGSANNADDARAAAKEVMQQMKTLTSTVDAAWACPLYCPEDRKEWEDKWKTIEGKAARARESDTVTAYQRAVGRLADDCKDLNTEVQRGIAAIQKKHDELTTRCKQLENWRARLRKYASESWNSQTTSILDQYVRRLENDMKQVKKDTSTRRINYQDALAIYGNWIAQAVNPRINIPEQGWLKAQINGTEVSIEEVLAERAAGTS